MKRTMPVLILLLCLLCATGALAQPEATLLAEGRATQTELYLYDSGDGGSTVLLVAGTHGNEEGGYVAAEALLESMEVTAGRVLLIPHANARAIAIYERTGPDGVDMNRSYPGDPNGNDIEALTAEIIDLIETYQPAAVIDMHEGRNLYGVDGSIGNSVIVGMTPNGFAVALAVLDYVNARNGDLTPFTYDANAPQGSLNHTASALLGYDAFTIETPQIYPLDVRVGQQLLFVRAFLDAYGIEADW